MSSDVSVRGERGAIGIELIFADDLQHADENRQRFMGTEGVPDRYRLSKEGEIVEVQYLYCHPGPDGKLIQAKYFGKVRDDIEIAECGVSQLKVKANDCDSIES